MSDDGCGSSIRSSFLVELEAVNLVLDMAIRDWVTDLFFSFSRFFAMVVIMPICSFFFFFLGFSAVMSDDGCGLS